MLVSLHYLLLVLPTALGLIATEPVSKLLSRHAPTIQALKDNTASILGKEALAVEPYSNDVFYLRYCCKDEAKDDCLSLLKSNLAWRNGDGKNLCTSAQQAVEKAQASPNKWNNEPVLQAAPYSSKIQTYMTPTNALTTTASTNDLLYIIRAGQIDDVSLMEAVTVDEMVEFFLYAKEVNAIVANQRSLQTDKLLSVVTANDLQGVKLIGGSATFRQALSKSSKLANDLYPNTAGPTLLLNLPPLLSALVKLFTPLFPKAVNERLKFASLKLLANIGQLTNVAPGGGQRAEFIKEVDAILD
ncbi:hypothetical protein MPSEU_000449900 [Mayamaea pseudoterrestris]|nr:hypothetical protein MPSEU_000449900 [Mayamaea pseudoterrestris]